VEGRRVIICVGFLVLRVATDSLDISCLQIELLKNNLLSLLIMIMFDFKEFVIWYWTSLECWHSSILLTFIFFNRFLRFQSFLSLEVKGCWLCDPRFFMFRCGMLPLLLKLFLIKRQGFKLNRILFFNLVLVKCFSTQMGIRM
jgi:hypothetical protein